MKILMAVLRLIGFIFESIFELFYTLFQRFVLKKRRNSGGYVYKESNAGRVIYEHREVAESVLGRRLNKYEVVHHINGKTNDNDISNLCVMDSIEHDRFHKWCDYIFKTYKRYPKRETQLKKLKENHRGILLNEVSQSKFGAG